MAHSCLSLAEAEETVYAHSTRVLALDAMVSLALPSACHVDAAPMVMVSSCVYT